MKHTYARKDMGVVKSEKFTRLCSLTYASTDDEAHEERKWEMVQRTTRTTPIEAFKRSPAPIPVDAVEICATLRRAEELFILVVAQYRPPLDAVCLEFPAGLVDAGENYGEAAIRELREETGYSVDASGIVSISPPLSTEPGLTDSCCVLVRLSINGNLPENQHPQQVLDDGEDIEVLLIPVGDCNKAHDALSQAVGKYEAKGQRTVVDAKLYTFFDAMTYTRGQNCPSAL
ncbi:nudix hydrolase-like protein [Leptomonas pyrrhocoris]|uniref:Nudix hydrolase-like protein n=1 Tax=Leptomonas pyrrhocoris TaxID=157538 RepID=A0A0M9G309_LEPPY|nr:nudix hydrolase-like protein [Leptomonas pyrrhocoris]KPA81380.1 nudix hydrolase-like protein [Leptomonas pyrrhocoris]|eukprot:XP_015659819.1 nudix hydrolase-like protein [Leptomonas pyrrhocoris]